MLSPSRYISNRNRFGFGLFTIFIFSLLIYRESAKCFNEHQCQNFVYIVFEICMVQLKKRCNYAGFGQIYGCLLLPTRKLILFLSWRLKLIPNLKIYANLIFHAKVPHTRGRAHPGATVVIISCLQKCIKMA
jgi:hypothetical protein